MSTLTQGFVAIVITTALAGTTLHAQVNEVYYQDDDLLCGAGFSPDSYHQRIWQHNNDIRQAQIDARRAGYLEAAAAQKARDNIAIARKVRFEKEKQQRQRRIQQRKGETGSGK